MRVATDITNVIQNAKFKPVQEGVFKHYFIKSAPINNDVFIKSTQETKKTGGLCSDVKNTLNELFNKYFKKINTGKNFVEGVNIEKCEDAGLFSSDLLKKIKESGDVFSMKDLCQMQDMHDLGLYSIDDIIKYRGSEAKLTTLGNAVNFSKEAQLTTSLEEYVENISHFVKKDPHALEVSTKNIDKYIALKGEPISNRVLYRGIVDDEEITHILSRVKDSNPQNKFYSPNRLTSTSKDIDVACGASQKKCVLKIQVPNGGTDKAAKSIDINKYYDAKGLKNDFAFQKEVLLPSDCKFQLIDAKEKDGTIFVDAKLV